MEQVELLWNYQQADMEADAFETEIKRDPSRLALMKNREFLVEQQETVKRMEEEVAEILDRMDVIRDAIGRQEEQLLALQKRLQDTPPENLEQAQTLASDAQKLYQGIAAYEQEMKRIQRDAADRERSEKEIRVRYAKVRAEYNQQKTDYDTTLREQKKQLEEKRRVAQEREAGLEPGLLERYRLIKQHIVPPVARLMNDQCGGCTMNLPSVTLRNIKSGSLSIECETCGRMLVQL